MSMWMMVTLFACRGEPDLESEPVPYGVVGDFLGELDGGKFQPLWIEGINLGVGVPGTQPGELAPTEEQYDAWFDAMSRHGFDTLRIYTLHYPRFYDALERHNLAHPERPLRVLHGIWLDEELPAPDLYSADDFSERIAETVDAAHGSIEIPARFGRAYGTYETDISRWVVGWVIGREVYPEEVLATDEAHASERSLVGEAFCVDDANPTTVWVGRSLDAVVAYERDTYGQERPVSFSSWPTLDPLTHPTEVAGSTEDAASFDLNAITPCDAPAGLFATYHAYPYYPDFVSDEPGYSEFSDDEGVNNYLGYLTALADHYNMPLLIGEVGVPSSWGSAHESVSGMDHGGHDEQTQMEMNARLMRTSWESGTAGAVLFAWMDEWWKPTWITDPLDFPRDRRPLWWNVSAPEQNYGLYSFVPAPAPWSTHATGGGPLRKIELSADAVYFHARVTLSEPLSDNDTLVLGFDTYRNDLGERVLPDGSQPGARFELALEITRDGADLLVTEAYDLFGIWHGTPRPGAQFRSVPSTGKPWLPVEWKTNGAYTSQDGETSFPERVSPVGQLRVRGPGEPVTSMDAVVFTGAVVDVRLPWTLLQFTDPSSLEVMHDDPATPTREVAVSEGIRVAASLKSTTLTSSRLAWAPWDTPPPTTFTPKQGLQAVEQVLAEFEDP